MQGYIFLEGCLESVVSSYDPSEWATFQFAISNVSMEVILGFVACATLEGGECGESA